ncbi:MAG: VOC family protein [Hyphomicrobiales bacterium]|nr:VOC family protein [Hyphomicrobiales bacterium]MDE2116231.1 VOC family protein [Hyphomicrobiales bacterium]
MTQSPSSIVPITMVPQSTEMHVSLRVHDLAVSTEFYTKFFGVLPKDILPRYTTFIVPHLNLNFVIVINDKGEKLDTYSLHHLGLGLSDKQAVIDTYHRALAMGATVVKPPRTTWRGTPEHELWLRDPTGYDIEIYARLTPDELAQMPADKEPVFLVPGTEPKPA